MYLHVCMCVFMYVYVCVLVRACVCVLASFTPHRGNVQIPNAIEYRYAHINTPTSNKSVCRCVCIVDVFTLLMNAASMRVNGVDSRAICT